MKAIMEKPTLQEQKIAKSFVKSFRQSNDKTGAAGKGFVNIRIEGKTDALKIPKKVLAMMSTILTNMAEGKSITLLSSDDELTTQEAADMIKISRPHLVKILEDGIIPFKKVGVHRRIKLTDLILYHEQMKEKRNKHLDILTKQAQDLNLGY